jgi:DNA methyltransferase 1-associated protein 1
MADVKDILGVGRGGAPPEARKPEKKERMKRPEGMSREAFALLGGGANPAIPRHMLDGFKKKEAKPKPSHKGVVTFQWKPFVNQARKDNLQLRHWTKGFKDATGRIRDAHEGDYQFAKYNKKVGLGGCGRGQRPREEGWAGGVLGL